MIQLVLSYINIINGYNCVDIIYNHHSNDYDIGIYSRTYYPNVSTYKRINLISFFQSEWWYYKLSYINNLKYMYQMI